MRISDKDGDDIMDVLGAPTTASSISGKDNVLEIPRAHDPPTHKQRYFIFSLVINNLFLLSLHNTHKFRHCC